MKLQDGSLCREVFKNMLGRKISSIVLTADKASITFVFMDGHRQRFMVDSDCCSTSWIEHLETPADLHGAELVDIEESKPVNSSHHDSCLKHVEGHSKDDDCCLQLYMTIFVTTAGHVTLEYRNSSNGYYGGNLVPVEGA